MGTQFYAQKKKNVSVNVNGSPTLWFHGHACNYPWPPFHASVALAPSHSRTVWRSCSNAGSVLAPDLDTHELMTTVEKQGFFFGEQQLINHFMLLEKTASYTQEGLEPILCVCVCVCRHWLCRCLTTLVCIYIMSWLVLILLSIFSVAYVIFMHSFLLKQTYFHIYENMWACLCW